MYSPSSYSITLHYVYEEDFTSFIFYDEDINASIYMQPIEAASTVSAVTVSAVTMSAKYAEWRRDEISDRKRCN